MASRLSFKNVGIKEFSSEDTTNTSTKSIIPVGIATPLELDYSGNGLLVMNMTLAEQLDDNYKNLIFTNWGERVAKYNFGANLRPLLSDFSNKNDFDQEVMIRINTATARWMPFIVPENYSSDILRNERTPVAKVRLQIEYSVPRLNIANRNIEVVLFTI